jgi:capsular exopolysaccharide synthesis family protein
MTSVSLAITLAQSGLRVLLVDTDMRRPRLHKVFGVPSTMEGLSSAIVGEADVRQLVRETGIHNVSLLPCGAMPPNPAELLHADRFKGIFQTLRETYDRVIFDSPPIGAVTDAAILARLVDGVVLVAKGGRTSKEALRRSRRELSGENVQILGCILNDLDLSDRNSYGYYYYYSHYGYYSTDDEERPAGGRRAKSSAS